MAAGQGLSTLDRARCATLCGSLSEPSQLPDIPDPSFVLHWDFADDGSRKETLIKHGDNVIFAELPAYSYRQLAGNIPFSVFRVLGAPEQFDIASAPCLIRASGSLY